MKKLFKTGLLMFFMGLLVVVLTRCNDSNELKIVTNIVNNQTVKQEEYSFTASAKYGTSEWEIVVRVNDVVIEKTNGQYSVLLELNKNIIILTATKDNKEHSETYIIYYSPKVELGFEITTNIVNNQTVEQEEYSFTASAKYGTSEWEIVVRVNDVVIEKTNEEYSVLLELNKNTITLTATKDNKVHSETYTINYLPKSKVSIEIETDIDSVEIIDDVIAFSAEAICGEKLITLTVLHNGEMVEGKLDKYLINLITGENKILLIAGSDGKTKTVEKTIDYKGFRFNTDLKEEDTVNEILKFRAGATYGKEAVILEIMVNGQKVEGLGISYSAKLIEGENIISFIATVSNIVKTTTYNIGYTNALPTIETSIVDERIYKGNIFNFDVIARDGLERKIADTQISFSVDLYLQGKFIENSDIKKVWDDSFKTSFKINFKEGSFAEIELNKSFILRITATDSFGKSVFEDYILTYAGPDEDLSIGEVVFSLEAFTVGLGYLIEPIKVKVFEDNPFAKTLIDLITNHGWSYRNTGSSNSSFYLSAISGLDLTGNKIPDELWQHINNKQMNYNRSISGSTLSEFSYGSGSGWMYSVNGVFPNFGFADYYPQDGDIIRVQFTLLLGDDIGGGVAVAGSSSSGLLIDNPEYGPIMKILANINKEELIDEAIYNEVIGAISIWNITKAEMALQIEKLTPFLTKTKLALINNNLFSS